MTHTLLDCRRSDRGLDSQKLSTKLMHRRNHAHRSASEPGMPILALLSHDGQLTETVQGAAWSKWSVVKPGIAQLIGLIHEPNVKLVIFDDQMEEVVIRYRKLCVRCRSDVAYALFATFCLVKFPWFGAISLVEGARFRSESWTDTRI